VEKDLSDLTNIFGVHNGQKDHKCDSCGKEFSQGVVGFSASAHPGASKFPMS